MNKFKGKKLKKKSLLWLVILLILISCTKTDQEIEIKDTIINIAEVESTKVKLVDIEPEISSFGSISFLHKTDISCAIDGIIRNITVEEGESVKSGEILATIENVQMAVRKQQSLSDLRSSQATLQLIQTKYREGRLQIEARLLSHEKSLLKIKQRDLELQNIEQTLSDKEELYKLDGISENELISLRLQFNSAKTEYEGILMDHEISVIGFRDSDILNAGFTIPETEEDKKRILIDLNTMTLQAEVEVAKARLETSEAEVSSIDLLLKELEIKAEYSGILGARYMEEGERVKSGTKLFTTFTNEKVYATFPVQESRIIQLEIGQEVEMTIPALNNKIVTGEIKVISPMIDPQSGNINVKAIFLNSEGALLPGMFAQVKIKTGKSVKRLVIPIQSILQKQGNKGEVFIYYNGKVFLKQIILGNETNNQLEVLEGLENDEIIVVNPAPFLQEGMNVQLKD